MSAGGGINTTSQNSSNMYRVGDYVFFENSNSGPYAIRRIEELNKSASGNSSCFMCKNILNIFILQEMLRPR